MLIFSDKSLAFLANTKTGSTAVEMALRGHADVHFRKRRKHVNAVKFRNQVRPFFSSAFGVELRSFAVMRDPVDQLRSWYKYRSRPMRKGDATSTEGISFDTFIEGVIADDPPPYAQVGSQQGFLCNGKGALCADLLFQYERMQVLIDFLSDVFNEDIRFPVKNVSPEREADLSEDLRHALRAARPVEFALYDALDAAGGKLTTV